MLEQLVVNGVVLDEIEAEQTGELRQEELRREQEQYTPTPPSSPLVIDEPWSSPSTYTKLAKQAEAIQHLL